MKTAYFGINSMGKTEKMENNNKQKRTSKMSTEHILVRAEITDSIIRVLNSNTYIDGILQLVCEAIYEPSIQYYPLSVRLKFGKKVFANRLFKESNHLVKRDFVTPDKKKGRIELFVHPRSRSSKPEQMILEGESIIDTVVALLNGALSRYQFEMLLENNLEREKELNSINRTTHVLRTSATLDNSLQEICLFLPEAMQYPANSVCRIRFGEKVFMGANFEATEWVLRQSFETPDGKTGSIELFYTQEFPESDEGPFLSKERNLIDNLASLISGSANKASLQQLLASNTERLKELKGINTTSEILKQSKNLDEALPRISRIIPESWQYPEFTVARITYNQKVYTSPNFEETPWRMAQVIETSHQGNNSIEIFYLKEFPEAHEGPFLKEERNLLNNLANLIAGLATRDVLNKLLLENTERLKELQAINQTSQIIETGKGIDETLQNICDVLPMSWQYPNQTVARIRFESKEYTSAGFQETIWSQKESFITIDNNKGIIEIFYLKKFPYIHEGPFLKEERDLLINIAKLVSGYLNSFKGREYYYKNVSIANRDLRSDEFRKSLVKTKKPLQLYFNQQAIDKYVYLDMMKYKVKHILFVANLYDAFVLESEDSFFERFMGEIYQYSLFSLPRITGVSTPEEALELLETTHFDLVILMVGIDRITPITLSEQIKSKHDTLPIYLLLNKKDDVKHFEELVPTIRSVDKVFVWNGDSLVIFAIVKSIEDKANVENDTRVGLVRVILLIEDSPLYYSRYLQMLYSIVFGQVQRILPEVEKNELDKICKMRSRPKILLARNYEEALTIFNKYKDFLLCVISDVEFDRGGKPDNEAGFKVLDYIKSHISNLPVILQSSDTKNEIKAQELGLPYINKNSETLIEDLRRYLSRYLGFGNFVFRDKEGNKLGVARSLREFETLMREVPDESLYLHASENQFSLWLMARGEIELAKTLNPISIDNFKDLKESRKFFLDTIKRYREEKKKGKILSFDETATLDEKNIVMFASGSLGGKGRGLAFINTLIYNIDFPTLANKINILTPITVIVGTNEFMQFISRNGLAKYISDPNVTYEQLRELFYRGNLSDELIDKIRSFVNQIDKPIAVRSSSTSEDSLTQPFAGVFDTYIVPNSDTNKELVLERITNAIKLVYVSVYSDKARVYFNAIHHKIEEERMAVVLQELVGNRHENYYYPHISGVAQSYNYYPFAHMKPDEGFAVAAVGLGSYVVDGWKSYRFSPKYPKISMYAVKDLLNSSQVKFFALDCAEKHLDFLRDGELAALEMLDISVAEQHGALKHCVSVYNPQNDRIEPGLSGYGPRVVNFSEILSYDYIPLAETISALLNSVKDAFGSPVEIEWAVDLNRTKNNLPTFYLLQIKPLVGNQITPNVNFNALDKTDMILYTRSSLGNGELNDIQDVIYIDNAKFSKLKTLEMLQEIEYLNNIMNRQDKQYILIGPGRWGTRDQFLGIPVAWSQISNARVIVEVSLENYPLDSSLGSHFFHNVTSMNIGYFSVQHNSATDFIQWDVLDSQEIVAQTNYFKHIRFKKPVQVIMDGINKTSTIIFKNDE